MTDRKRIYAIHIRGGEIYVYRKTRFQRESHRQYTTRRGDALAVAMQAAGYPAQPFVEGDWVQFELPYRMVFSETGLKFEIPGRFDNLDSFYHLRPSIYARIKGIIRRTEDGGSLAENDADAMRRQIDGLRHELKEPGLYARRE